VEAGEGLTVVTLGGIFLALLNNTARAMTAGIKIRITIMRMMVTTDILIICGLNER